MADPVQHVAGLPGDLGAVGQRHALAGVEVEDQPVRVLWLAVGGEAPLRHVQLQRRELAQPGQGR